MMNTEVRIFSGSSTPNGWGDETFTEGAPVIVAGHIGNERDSNDRDGLIIRRCRIRLPQGTVTDGTTVFEVDGKRWKPLAGKTSRNPQNHLIFECQRLD